MKYACVKEGITAKGIWIKEIGLEQVFIYFRIDLYVNKRREGGSLRVVLEKE